ncbi:MAG TPA: methylmalonyl Co-A mutase-associated GTPase MeaB [Polyangiaceae bacterium]|nr:methylmalonyl Co-A mutase-associated GTPase MeaB [Polyangiaceae bacterium]
MADELWLERLARLRAGERRALGQVCRALEELREPGLVRALYRTEAQSVPWVIGITGAPGVGKSSLVSALIEHFRAAGKRVGIVAVDPTSPFYGGALLGDRVRMQRHHADPDVFVHSVATHGAHGGLSLGTAELVMALGQWGASIVILETVGVGQAEFDVMSLADTTALVLAPGLGDDLQAQKAGIMEVADVYVVNKADLPGARRVVADVQSLLSLSDATRVQHGHHAHSVHSEPAATGSSDRQEIWPPRVVECSATSGQGISLLAQALNEHDVWLKTAPGRERLAARRKQAAARRIEVQLLEHLRAQRGSELAALAHAVSSAALDPHTAALRLLGSDAQTEESAETAGSTSNSNRP